MAIVIFEDDKEKFDDIRGVLLKKGVKENYIIRIQTIAQFAALKDTIIDLCIIDIIMPAVDGGQKRSSAGYEILNMLDYSDLKRVPVLSITAYPEEIDGLKEKFSARGCIVFDYEARNTWTSALDVYLAQARDRGRYDFIVFTGLAKERAAFANISGFSFERVVRSGIDHWECQIGDLQGTIVALPRMGVVQAAASVARVLEQYSPRVCAMSGICGGIGDGAKLGQLLVTDVCWEYQSGKWLDDVFESEPYQVGLGAKTRASIRGLLENDKLIDELEAGFSGTLRPSQKSNPKLAIFATGSAVIASAQRLKALEKQHRKVAGVDMEIFGFHLAAEVAGHPNLQAISAKVVVDKADESKNDDLHAYGCFVSARFVVKAIGDLLRQ